VEEGVAGIPDAHCAGAPDFRAWRSRKRYLELIAKWTITQLPPR